MLTSSGNSTASLGRVTARAMLVAAVLALVCAFWVVGSEVVTATCLVGEAVPSIPALGCLLGLLLLNPFLGRVTRRWALRR